MCKLQTTGELIYLQLRSKLLPVWITDSGSLKGKVMIISSTMYVVIICINFLCSLTEVLCDKAVALELASTTAIMS